jgi:hypothetical protein
VPRRGPQLSNQRIQGAALRPETGPFVVPAHKRDDKLQPI